LLEKEVEQLREENPKSFVKRMDSYDRNINASKPKSGDMGDHTCHRAKTNQIKRSRPCPVGTRTTNSHMLSVTRLIEKLDTNRNSVMLLIQIKKSRSPVTAVQSVVMTSTSRQASAPDSSRRFPIHSRQR